MSSVQSGDSASTTPLLRTKMRLPPIGFWSYARQDDELSNGDLTQLRTQVRSALQRQFGRTPIEIFQDTSAIPHGAKWEKEIRHSLFNSTFFIPILTPNFLQSEWCCREVQLFLERQQQLYDTYPDLPRESRIFPILYVDVRRADTIDPAVATLLNSLQAFDFQDLQYETAAPIVRKAIANFATSIRDLLLIEVDRPPSPDEVAAAEAAADAAARAEAAAKALAERNALMAAHDRDRLRFTVVANRLDPALAHSKASAAQRAAEDARREAEAAKAKAVQEAKDRERLEAEMRAAREREQLAQESKRALEAASEEALEAGRLSSEHDGPLEQASVPPEKSIASDAGTEGRGISRKWLLGGAAALVGLLAALLWLRVIYLTTNSPTPRDTGNVQAAVTGNLAGDGAGDIPKAPPGPAKPRFAAEPWITAHSWAAGGNCDAPVSFSIDGNDLIVVQGNTPERHAIDAAKSTDDRLVADGLTLSRRLKSAAESRITMIYPDLKVEVSPCATRR